MNSDQPRTSSRNSRNNNSNSDIDIDNNNNELHDLIREREPLPGMASTDDSLLNLYVNGIRNQHLRQLTSTEENILINDADNINDGNSSSLFLRLPSLPQQFGNTSRNESDNNYERRLEDIMSDALMESLATDDVMVSEGNPNILPPRSRNASNDSLANLVLYGIQNQNNVDYRSNNTLTTQVLLDHNDHIAMFDRSRNINANPANDSEERPLSSFAMLDDMNNGRDYNEEEQRRGAEQQQNMNVLNNVSDVLGRAMNIINEDLSSENSNDENTSVAQYSHRRHERQSPTDNDDEDPSSLRRQ